MKPTLGKGVYVGRRGDNDTGAIRYPCWSRQLRTPRGFDKSRSAVGELRDHLWRSGLWLTASPPVTEGRPQAPSGLQVWQHRHAWTGVTVCSMPRSLGL